MRVFVFGVLFARTLHAQSDGSDGTVSALDEPAPLITPGSTAPTEADLLGTTTDAVIDDAGATAVGGADASPTGDTDLPTGTADVIVDTTPTETTSEEPTITDEASDDFGAGETAGPGVEINGSDFTFPTPSDASDAPEETTTSDDLASTAVLTSVGELGPQITPTSASTAVGEIGEQATASDEFGLGEQATTSLDSGADATLIDAFSGDAPGATSTNDLLDDIATESPVAEPDFGTEPTEVGGGVEGLAAATPEPDADAAELSDAGDITDPSVVIPDADATPTLDGGVSNADVTEDPSILAPEESETGTIAAPDATEPATLEDPGTGTEPIDAAPTESSSTIDLAPTPLADPLAAPEVTPSLDGAQADGVGAAYADNESPGTWTGDDAGNYDGQDIGDEECPASCYEKDDSHGTTSTSTSTCSAEASDAEADNDNECENDSEPAEDSLVKKVVRWISRRALGSDDGFAAFSFPINQRDKTATYDSDDEQDCDDVPGWLYESSGKTPDACPAPKPKCPAKCYEHGQGPKPYPVSSASGGYDTYSSPAASSNGYPVYSTPPASSNGYPVYSSAVYSPYPMSDASSMGYYETVSSTQTTFVTSTTTVAGGYQDSGARAGYTGDTLASVCPKTCDPFNPAANKCDITSSCTTTGKGKYYCACRAGFRASAWNAKDFSKQFKFPDQPYVYTAEGVVCDKVCSDQTCTEVLSRPQCQ